MDKNTYHLLNDVTDVVEELAKIVREINPGANWAFIDFMVARIDRQLNEAHDAIEEVT